MQRLARILVAILFLLGLVYADLGAAQSVSAGGAGKFTSNVTKNYGFHGTGVSAQGGYGEVFDCEDYYYYMNIGSYPPGTVIDLGNGGGKLFIGGPNKDTILGTPFDDIIYGLGGNDVLKGQGGDDVICGGDGNDTIEGNAGDDQLFGEGGDDLINGGAGDDLVVGDYAFYYYECMSAAGGFNVPAGKDYLHGGDGDDFIIGDSYAIIDYSNAHGAHVHAEGTCASGGGFYLNGANDQLWGDNGDDYLVGDQEIDEYTYTQSRQVAGLQFDYGVGNDQLYGGNGDDWLVGDVEAVDAHDGGNDKLDGGAGYDILVGDNYIYYTYYYWSKSKSYEADCCYNGTFYGIAGNDLLIGGNQSDVLIGDNIFEDCSKGGSHTSRRGEGLQVDGDDKLDGGSDRDGLFGDDAEVIYGCSSSCDIDFIADAFGGGDDFLNGGSENDYLHGGAGRDRLDGNAGTEDVCETYEPSTFVGCEITP